MKAVCWHGAGHVLVEDVDLPRILVPGDAIVRVTLTAICGSDLHLYGGHIPAMKDGDILGHEAMGQVVEVGPSVQKLKPGDRVVIPFTISCGRCWFCERQLFALCDNSNPNAGLTEEVYGAPTAGIYGYSHLMGGYAGGQAEYIRVPFADFGPIKVPEEVPDEKALFLSDILPTAWQAIEACDVKAGSVIAIWGCGPVGQLAIKCAYLQGAERVIAIDDVPERLEMAEKHGGAQILDLEKDDVMTLLKEFTGGRGPDACVDAVGMEAHGHGLDAWYDRVKHAVRLQTDRPTALRHTIRACRKGGTISIPGVYGGVADRFPLGIAFNKGLTLRMGQTHVQRYMPELLERVKNGEIDPSSIITHRLRLEEAPRGYELFQKKEEGCVKVVLRPGNAESA